MKIPADLRVVVDQMTRFVAPRESDVNGAPRIVDGKEPETRLRLVDERDVNHLVSVDAQSHSAIVSQIPFELNECVQIGQLRKGRRQVHRARHSPSVQSAAGLERGRLLVVASIGEKTEQSVTTQHRFHVAGQTQMGEQGLGVGVERQ